MSKAKLKIKKGDKVIVLAGRDKGQKGEVLKVLREETAWWCRASTWSPSTRKPTQVSAGGKERKELPIHISNVAIADPKGGKATRVGFKTLKDGKKVRFARKSGETIE
jgi:large subunit ribosomal protein L24